MAWLVILGFILVVLGIILPLISAGAFAPFSLPMIGFGIIILIIGAAVTGISVLFDFLIKYWFVVVPIVAFLAFKFFYKEVNGG